MCNICVVSKRNATAVKAGAVRVHIGRPSLLGNPFMIGRDGTRLEVISKYKQWLWLQMQNSEAVQAELNKLVALVKQSNTLELECWCAPLPCHGDVVAEAIKYLMQRDAIHEEIEDHLDLVHSIQE